MFDRIVERDDRDDWRRSAASLAITTSLCGAAVVGFLVGSLVCWVAPTDPLPPEVPIAFLDPEGGGQPALPAAPQAPAAPSNPDGTASDPDLHATATPASPTATSTPSSPSGGTPDEGTGGGRGGGHTDHEGRQDGVGDGPPGDPPPLHQVIPHRTMTVKRRVDPAYPESARTMGLGEQHCLATVRVDAEGVPYEVDVASCPGAFRQETEQALLKWRWYPARDGRERITAQTTVSVVFRLDQ